MPDRSAAIRGFCLLVPLATLATLTALAACSSFTVAPAATGGDAGSGSADAGSSSIDDAAAPDAAEGGPGDASACMDTFCTGFDEVPPLGSWDVPLTSNGATARVDTMASTSPPSSLHLATSASASAAGSASAALRRDFGTYQGLRCAFDVRMAAFGPAGTAAQVLAIEVTGTTKFYQVIIDLFGDGKLQVSTQQSGAASTGYGKTNSVIGTGAWQRLSLDVSFANTVLPAQAILRVDNDVLLTVPLSPPIVMGTVSVQLGLNNVTPGNALWDMRVDNVACTPK